MDEYERVKNKLKKRYDDRRTGEQTLYIDQSERLQPLIDKQKETAKETTEAIKQIGHNTSNALLPYVNELKKRNEQVENLQSLPFYATPYPGIEAIPQSTPKKDTSGFIIDLDKMLSESDIENLQDMSLPLPSEVIKQGTYDEVLQRIKMLNRQCGQYTGKNSKKDEREKQIYKSRRGTLEIYRMSLDEQMKALKYRTGEGLQKRKRKVYKHLDKMLSESDIKNLQDMRLPLPSEVIKQGTYDEVLQRIKTLNRQCGQHTGKNSKKDEREKQIYKSRRETLKMYRMSLDEQMKALKYKTGEGLQKRKREVYKQKRGRGRPKIYPDIKHYNSPDDLWRELNKHIAAKEAGNTGLDNILVSILDELLINKEIDINTHRKWNNSLF